MYANLKATTKKVLKLLKFPADMTAKQKHGTSSAKVSENWMKKNSPSF
jgi:hypothetical protein